MWHVPGFVYDVFSECALILCFRSMSTKWKPVSNLEAGKPLPDEEVDFILIGAGLLPLKVFNHGNLIPCRPTSYRHNVNIHGSGDDTAREMSPYGQVLYVISASYC